MGVDFALTGQLGHGDHEVSILGRPLGLGTEEVLTKEVLEVVRDGISAESVDVLFGGQPGGELAPRTVDQGDDDRVVPLDVGREIRGTAIVTIQSGQPDVAGVEGLVLVPCVMRLPALATQTLAWRSYLKRLGIRGSVIAQSIPIVRCSG